jgi:hypothetical protein
MNDEGFLKILTGERDRLIGEVLLEDGPGQRAIKSLDVIILKFKNELKKEADAMFGKIK